MHKQYILTFGKVRLHNRMRAGLEPEYWEGESAWNSTKATPVQLPCLLILDVCRAFSAGEVPLGYGGDFGTSATPTWMWWSVGNYARPAVPSCGTWRSETR